MKKIIIKGLSIALSIAIMITVLPLVGIDLFTIANAKTLSEYEVGDIVEFGSYPQSEVTDEALISTLNSLSKTWVSYGYYIGTGDLYDGQMQPSDYMKFADVTHNGAKYRAVTFSQYRPCYTGYTSSSSNTYQDENGYYPNNVYWFKYEPLKWRVLDPNKGFIMCENIIDSQAYNNTIYYNGSKYYQDKTCTNYANDYATSSIRDWLNNDFYNTAFTETEKIEIQYLEQDNSCIDSSHLEYDSDTKYDKIFFLSYNDANNSEYGFPSNSNDHGTARRARGTDYAKAQGLGTNSWWIHSPSGSSPGICGDSVCGYHISFNGYDSVYHVYRGVRPALNFNPKSEISESGHNHDFENGTCTECNATDHDYFAFSIQEPSTKRIRCRDGIVLHTNIVGNLSRDARIEWTSSNNNFSVDKSNSGDEITIISKNNGYTTFTATVYDANNKVIAEDTIEMYSKASFFDKIGGFFRSIFGRTKIFEY